MDIRATRLETDEEVRQAVLKYRPGAGEGLPPRREPAPPDDSPPLFRPTQRPATPILLVLDDGSNDEGQWIRIRQEEFVIGRTEGDLRIGLDSQISSRHAALRYKQSKGKKPRWQLVDLASTNGTFVRISHALLTHGQEFIIGRARFRFEDAQQADKPTPPPVEPGRQVTRAWQSESSPESLPSLVRSDGANNGHRTLLAQDEIWLGKDSGYCQVVLADDPFASARHARICRDREGRWTIENNKSLNGLWLKVERLTMSGTARFLLGEQQFLFRVPR